MERDPKRICILGLGHIGLPTATALALAGHSVVGVDINPAVLRRLRNGDPYLEEPQLGEALQSALDMGRLEVRESPTWADVYIIAVPTPATPDKNADLSYVVEAGRSLTSCLRKGNLVILESTVPPFATERVLVPLLESSGLKVGVDLFVAYSPERVLPGHIWAELVQNERIIGGIDPRSSQLAQEVYLSFVKGEIYLTDAATAEMVKLMENTYRDVNIALGNEFAMLAQEAGLNAWEAIRLANRHPRVNIHLPGPGVGGHCIAIDPWFLAGMVPQATSLIRIARQVNHGMPAWVIGMLKKAAAPEAGPIAVLGVTYKANVGDTRESPALEVVSQARALGYQVRVHDPHVRDLPGEEALLPLEEAAAGAQALVVLTDHKEFQNLDVDKISSLMTDKVLLDTRNCLDHEVWRRHGFRVLLLGKGSS